MVGHLSFSNPDMPLINKVEIAMAEFAERHGGKITKIMLNPLYQNQQAEIEGLGAEIVFTQSILQPHVWIGRPAGESGAKRDKPKRLSLADIKQKHQVIPIPVPPDIEEEIEDELPSDIRFVIGWYLEHPELVLRAVNTCKPYQPSPMAYQLDALIDAMCFPPAPEIDSELVDFINRDGFVERLTREEIAIREEQRNQRRAVVATIDTVVSTSETEPDPTSETKILNPDWSEALRAAHANLAKPSEFVRWMPVLKRLIDDGTPDVLIDAPKPAQVTRLTATDPTAVMKALGNQKRVRTMLAVRS
jgi:hypothetical protein